MKILLQAKRMLRQPVFYLLLAAMIGSCLILARFSSISSETVQVGIYLEDSSEYPEEYAMLRTLFSEYEGMIIFTLEASEEELIHKVTGNDYECGYRIPGDLFESLAQQRTRNLIPLYVNQNTSLDLLANEVVFSILFNEYAFQILEDYLSQDPLLSDLASEELTEQARSLYLSYLSGENSFNFDYEYLGTNSIEERPGAESISEQDSTSTDPSMMLNGFIALFVLLAGFMGAYRYLHDRQQHLFDRMPVNQLHRYRFSYLLLYILPFTLCGIMLNPGNLLHQVVYLFLVLLFMLLLLKLLPGKTVLVSLLPIYLLGSLVFTPVFIDLSSYLSIGSLLQHCFLPYYMQQKSSLYESAALLALLIFVHLFLHFMSRMSSRHQFAHRSV